MRPHWGHKCPQTDHRRCPREVTIGEPLPPVRHTRPRGEGAFGEPRERYVVRGARMWSLVVRGARMWSLVVRGARMWSLAQAQDGAECLLCCDTAKTECSIPRAVGDENAARLL